MKQKRMAMYIACLRNVALQPLIKCLKENYPELQIEANSINKV